MSINVLSALISVSRYFIVQISAVKCRELECEAPLKRETLGNHSLVLIVLMGGKAELMASFSNDDSYFDTTP